MKKILQNVKVACQMLLPHNALRSYRIVRSHYRALEQNNHLSLLSVDHNPNHFAPYCELLVDRQVLLGKLPKHGKVAEIGVAHGDFSADILNINQPLELWLIDLWDSQSAVRGKIGGVSGLTMVQRRFAEEIKSGQVRLQQGFSTTEMERHTNEYFDWIYIDAAHDYDNVKRDLETAATKVKAHGFICGHDYTRWGSKGLARFGVVEAVNEFCIQQKWEIIYLTNEPHRHLSYALRASN